MRQPKVEQPPQPSEIEILAERSGIGPELVQHLSSLYFDEQRRLLELSKSEHSSHHSEIDTSVDSSQEGILNSDIPASIPPAPIDYEDELLATFDRPGHSALTNTLDEPQGVGNPQRRLDRTKEQIAQAYREEQNASLTSPTNNGDVPSHSSGTVWFNARRDAELIVQEMYCVYVLTTQLSFCTVQ